MSKPINMRFGGQTSVCPGNHVLVWYAHWHHLASMTEQTMFSYDAVCHHHYCCHLLNAADRKKSWLKQTRTMNQWQRECYRMRHRSIGFRPNFRISTARSTLSHLNSQPVCAVWIFTDHFSVPGRACS